MDELVKKLHQANSSFRVGLPGIKEAKEFLNEVLSLLIPHYRKKQTHLSIEDYGKRIVALKDSVDRLIGPVVADIKPARSDVAEAFISRLSDVYDLIMLDAHAICAGDPAAASTDEVILAYPGFLATAVHRVAHEFYVLNVPLIPRLMSEYAHRKTGIDIHPGAEIGKSFCIDHGSGTVIGETTIIRDSVKIYQGVTLGALSVDKKLADKKRHPTIEDNVVIYSNATILGGQTVIGRDSVIGGNVWITSSVPAKSLVYHTGETKVRREARSPSNL